MNKCERHIQDRRKIYKKWAKARRREGIERRADREEIRDREEREVLEEGNGRGVQMVEKKKGM